MTDVKVGDQTFRFPDNMSQDEISAALRTRFPQEDLTGTALESIAALPGGISQALEDATFTARVNDIPGSENPISAAASVIRPGLDVTGQVAGAGVDAWKATWGRHPLFDNPVVREGVSQLKNSKVADYAMKALTSGYDMWQEFAAENPNEAQVLEDIGVVAEAFSPKMPSKRIDRLAKKQRSKATVKDIEARRQGIQKLVRADDMESGGQIRESSTATGRRKIYEPTDREDTIIKTMELVDDVDPDRSYTYNHYVVDQEARRLNKKLRQDIVKNRNPRYDKSALQEELDLTIANINQQPGFHAMSGDAQQQAVKLMQEAQRLISESGSRATDLLKIRQEFDRLFTGAGGAYEASAINARTFAAREIRNVLNDTLKSTVPDADVHDLLTRQHNLLSGRDILQGKRAKEAHNMFSRVGHKLREIGHLPTTPLALAALGIAAAPLVPAAGATVAAGATGWQAYKLMKGPQRHRALASILSSIDRAAKREPTLATQLAPERALIVEMMKQSQEDEE